MPTAMIDDAAAVEQTKIVRVPKALVLPTAANRASLAAGRDAVRALGLPLHAANPRVTH